MPNPSLAADFPAATHEQWRQRVDAVLKGADFEKKLVSRTLDGIRIEPLYAKAQAGPQVGREADGRWRVAQRVDHPEAGIASELALADLEGGADSLTLVWRKAPAARGFGLRAETVDELDRALSGVMLDLVHCRLDAGGRGRAAAAMAIALAERRGHRLGRLDLDLGLDPIGAMAAMGRLSASWEIVGARCAETLSAVRGRGFEGRAFLADGRPYHEAGASEAQELAAVLATGVAYLRALEAGGHELEAARDALAFLLVADGDEILTIAKFRALRLLWARVEEACGLTPKPVRLHAETAWRMTTRRDPWVNVLRGTIAAFSAGIGGADVVTVLPFTAALGLPDAFARRLARNAQLVLLEEANLWRVADPAAGAGGFEAMTDALCEHGWRLFQEFEAERGIAESLVAGALQARIAAVRTQRGTAVAHRRDPITGTSEFPDLREAPVSVLLPAPPEPEDDGRLPEGSRPSAPSPAPARQAASGARGNSRSVEPFGGLVDAAAGGSTLAGLMAGASGADALDIAPLPSVRMAAPFERLRDVSDRQLARTGERPRLFLANLGPAAAFSARASFTKNFFEAGGIGVLGNDGFVDHAAMIEAFVKSKAKLACICSSDDIYVNEAELAAKALKRAGAARIYLAGRPRELQDVLSQAGVDDFIFAGCDVLRTLREAASLTGP